MNDIQTNFTKRELKDLDAALMWWLLSARQKQVRLDPKDAERLTALKLRTKQLIEAIESEER